ncbi:hypothetical protein AKJ40_02170 [candidate division MSBL1 archaeon SCGC-AAA259M10]|uniref:siroheme decarboxylase n=1 Tax=candidate division MSBL1 archaeon SCGC-AAA259M10 TaxID=1698270 RepID=A0A133V0H8_9EURY|nr:hypothetical protein AKJ40_02170 [candidate division MSBL1 archaeon SCGC-AAA259M10]
MDLDEKDREILKEIQEGIPIEKNPYLRVAESIGIETEELLNRLRNMEEKGAIRRFGASVNHRKFGYEANGVVVCEVDRNRLNIVGRKISEFDEVTHCYQRPSRPGRWDYNLYFVVHASSRSECEKITEKIIAEAGVDPEKYEIVYSTKAFKREGVVL